MYKCRSSQSSIIHLRYADILLLKAEALLLKSSPDLNGAANIINTIRKRAQLPNLSNDDKSSKDKLFEALMKERRMELAFEGQRWFDLIRLDLVESVMNNVFVKDSGRTPIKWSFTKNSQRLPIPLSVIDNNPNIVQNEGY